MASEDLEKDWVTDAKLRSVSQLLLTATPTDSLPFEEPEASPTQVHPNFGLHHFDSQLELGPLQRDETPRQDENTSVGSDEGVTHLQINPRIPERIKTWYEAGHIYASSLAQVRNFFKNRLEILGQTACKRIQPVLIDAICSNRRGSYPYTKARQRRSRRPPFWPKNLKYEGSFTSSKKDRLELLSYYFALPVVDEKNYRAISSGKYSDGKPISWERLLARIVSPDLNLLDKDRSDDHVNKLRQKARFTLLREMVSVAGKVESFVIDPTHTNPRIDYTQVPCDIRLTPNGGQSTASFLEKLQSQQRRSSGPTASNASLSPDMATQEHFHNTFSLDTTEGVYNNRSVTPGSNSQGIWSSTRWASMSSDGAVQSAASNCASSPSDSQAVVSFPMSEPFPCSAPQMEHHRFPLSEPAKIFHSQEIVLAPQGTGWFPVYPTEQVDHMYMANEHHFDTAFGNVDYNHGSRQLYDNVPPYRPISTTNFPAWGTHPQPAIRYPNNWTPGFVVDPGLSH